MIRIAAIDHVVLRVRDLERMIAFYRDVLGCSLEWRRARQGRPQYGSPVPAG